MRMARLLSQTKVLLLHFLNFKDFYNFLFNLLKPFDFSKSVIITLLQIYNKYIMVLTYKQKFNKKYGFKKDEDHSLDEISKITGFKKSGLQIIYNKGIGAFKTNPKSVRPFVKSKERWAMARVYAAINPTSKAYKFDKSHLKKK